MVFYSYWGLDGCGDGCLHVHTWSCVLTLISRPLSDTLMDHIISTMYMVGSMHVNFFLYFFSFFGTTGV
jgi:hypothetical protein